MKNKLNAIIIISTAIISIGAFWFFFQNGQGLSYNDARSHLDIARRVVEGLKPGLAQLGSVWLPLPHVLMALTVWNDFFWHTGLSGAIISMTSYVLTVYLILKILEELRVSRTGKILASIIFATNVNILYLQSTAMTELLLIFTMTASIYFLIRYVNRNNLADAIISAFFAMLSTLVRYDGWFLVLVIMGILAVINLKRDGYKKTEGIMVLFGTLAFAGIAGWFLWNLLIFKDPLYFAFGPFSAHAQQEQLLESGVLVTKGNIYLSIKLYLYALFYNSYTFNVVLATIGVGSFIFSSRISKAIKLAALSLLSPIIFNFLALYLGHSVLFIQGISGNTWFNVRYGVMLMPAVAIFIAFLTDSAKRFRYLIIALALATCALGLFNVDAVTIDDATIGASQKNVSAVSDFLRKDAQKNRGFILISAASHDAIIFSSGLPMKRFIHEGTGQYWSESIKHPEKWARWIVLRTNDKNDLTWKLLGNRKVLAKYELVANFPFADIYRLKAKYQESLVTNEVNFKK